jgi:hypothetical protein
VTPHGFIDAPSKALPVRVRLTSSQSSPITAQAISAIRISLVGVRTPKMLTTPAINGRIVTGLSLNR